MAQFRVWISVTRTSFSLSLSLESHAFVNVCARWYWDRNGWVKAAAEAERPTAQQNKSDITKDLWFQLFWVTVTWLHVCEILCELIIIQDQPRSTAQTQEETERAAKRIKRDGLALEWKKIELSLFVVLHGLHFFSGKTQLPIPFAMKSGGTLKFLRWLWSEWFFNIFRMAHASKISWHGCEVEIDGHCQKVLSSRMSEGCLPQVPIHSNVRDYQPSSATIKAKCRAVAAGFPCQVSPSCFYSWFLFNFFSSIMARDYLQLELRKGFRMRAHPSSKRCGVLPTSFQRCAGLRFSAIFWMFSSGACFVFHAGGLNWIHSTWQIVSQMLKVNDPARERGRSIERAARVSEVVCFHSAGGPLNSTFYHFVLCFMSALPMKSAGSGEARLYIALGITHPPPGRASGWACFHCSTLCLILEKWELIWFLNCLQMGRKRVFLLAIKDDAPQKILKDCYYHAS